MSAGLAKRLQLLASVLSVLVVLALLAAGFGWWRIRASLPPLDGDRPLAGLAGPVKIERDALGVPTITGATRLDVARATGYVHAQDRFFQMDLLRRSGAGELAELFGPAAVRRDQAHRLHGFRRLAGEALALFSPEKRAVLEAYTAGVNAGLAALRRPPWEYTVLRTDPQPWLVEDSLLVIYAMWFDLQESTGRLEFSLAALRDRFGQGVVDFLAPRGTSWDSALDGSTFPAAPLPAISFRLPKEIARPAEDPTPSGSNAFAVAGSSAGGAGLLASDMHLSLRVPHIWYRAALAWTDAAGTVQRVVGVTLPGVPSIVAGSNGRVAWGATVAYLDSCDVIALETDDTAQAFYRTTQGFREIEARAETIRVKGSDPVSFTARWTEWGPILNPPGSAQLYVLRWNAHRPEATNLELSDLETALTVSDAVAIAHRSGTPNINLVAADSAGSIAWTLAGLIPRRIGYDGRFPVSWAYGDRRWDGWVPAADIPTVINPPGDVVWSANQRMVGGQAYAKLGDGGYYGGARGAQIRDGLRQLVARAKDDSPHPAATAQPRVTAADLLELQLDNRALFYTRWQQLLLATLDADPSGQSARRELRAAVANWEGRAEPGSASYRLVHLWRLKVAERALAPFIAGAVEQFAGFDYAKFQYEDALWRLVHDQPASLLGPDHASWPALLLAAADAVVAEAERAGLAPAKLTQGQANILRMQHPFSRFLPAFLRGFLDMPAQPISGGSEMPRIQNASAGASQRMVVSPGREDEAIFHMPGGQSGNPLSPFYRAGHEAWVQGAPTPLLPGPVQHTLTLSPP